MLDWQLARVEHASGHVSGGHIAHKFGRAAAYIDHRAFLARRALAADTGRSGHELPVLPVRPIPVTLARRDAVEFGVVAEHAAEQMVSGAILHEQHHHVLDLALRIGPCRRRHAVHADGNAGFCKQLLSLGEAAAYDVVLEAPAMRTLHARVLQAHDTAPGLLQYDALTPHSHCLRRSQHALEGSRGESAARRRFAFAKIVSNHDTAHHADARTQSYALDGKTRTHAHTHTHTPDASQREQNPGAAHHGAVVKPVVSAKQRGRQTRPQVRFCGSFRRSSRASRPAGAPVRGARAGAPRAETPRETKPFLKSQVPAKCICNQHPRIPDS